MKSQNEIYELMDTIKPYLQKIAKDVEMPIQICMAADGRGAVCVYEYYKDVEHQHVVEIDKDGNAFNWHVNNSFVEAYA